MVPLVLFPFRFRVYKLLCLILLLLNNKKGNVALTDIDSNSHCQAQACQYAAFLFVNYALFTVCQAL